MVLIKLYIKLLNVQCKEYFVTSMHSNNKPENIHLKETQYM